MLFNETIKDNILFGKSRAKDTEVKTVAQQANALGFITQNNEDYSSE